MKIPKTYALLGNTIAIVTSGPFTYEGKECHGTWDSKTNTIQLDVETKDKDIVAASLCHEIVHSILDRTGNEDLNTDEDFVERMGQAMWQIVKTLEYD